MKKIKLCQAVAGGNPGDVIDRPRGDFGAYLVANGYAVEVEGDSTPAPGGSTPAPGTSTSPEGVGSTSQHSSGKGGSTTQHTPSDGVHSTTRKAKSKATKSESKSEN